MPRLLLVMVLTLLVAAPAAQAGTRADIVADCFDDGKLDGNYTASQIRDARNNLPADVDQYSDCRDVLSRALGGSGSKNVDGAGGGGRGSSAPLAASGPKEQRALEAAAIAGGAKPVQVGDTTVVPGASGFAAGAARNAIPTSLLVALILLGLTGLAAAARDPRRSGIPYLIRRVRARRHA
jgi:hypothetical protein